MHYANGRAAKAGDVVRGKGYNIKHEIIGVLVHATPGASACNCQVATVTKNPSLVTAQDADHLVAAVPASYLTGSGQVSLLTVEYGQLDAFVALDPETGEVLPPE